MLNRILAVACCVGFLVAVPTSSTAQQKRDRLDAIQRHLSAVETAYAKLPPRYKELMDSYGHLLRFSKEFPRLAANAGKISARVARPLQTSREPHGDGLFVSVNDRTTDQDFSGFEGITQSETSTAWCGNNVVVGFNDSGSELQTLFNGSGGLSFSGVAQSSDRGATFHDLGFVNPGPNFAAFIIGDPVLSCADPNNFYYSQLMTLNDFVHPAQTAVVLSHSNDGGNTWPDPVTVISKDGTTHFLDKSWHAIDPSNPSRIYVSYTDFDSSGTSSGCPGQVRAGIELVVSNDGGQTFGQPVVIDDACGTGSAVQASHVAISSNGTVYVAWERFNPANIDLRITHLAPGGTPAPATIIDQIVKGGSFIQKQDTSVALLLQGEFRDLVGIDLAVDHSRGPHNGTVYVIWDDARNKSIPDFFSIDSTHAYHFTDILFNHSADGTHFSKTVRVNHDREPAAGPGHDHFQPALAVDLAGKVAACWYDRRHDSENFLIERFCATSSDSGASWDEHSVPRSSFAPLHRLDDLTNSDYMGDYDGLTSDFTGASNGFLGAFEVMTSGVNPDVKAWSFPIMH